MSANKTYIFDIEIRGTKQAASTISELQKGLVQLRGELKNAEVGSESFKKIQTEIARVQAEIERVKPAAKALNANAKLDAAVPDSYKAWKAEIALLTAQLENLSEADTKGSIGQKAVARIKELSDKTKQFEENLGRFQSNVGNYEEGFLKALGMGRIGERIDAISQKFGALGSTIAGAGVAGAIAAGVIKIGQTIANLVKEFDDAKKAVEDFASGTEQNTSKAAETLLALSKASGQSAEELSKQAAEVAKKNSISFEEALQRISGTLSAKQQEAFERNKKLAAEQAKLSDALGRLGEKLAPVFDFIKNTGTQILTNIVDLVSGYIDTVSNLFTSIKEGASSVLNTITLGYAGVSAAERDARARAEEERQKDLERQKEALKEIEGVRQAYNQRLVKGLGDAYLSLSETQKAQFVASAQFARSEALRAGKDAGEAADIGFKEGLKGLPATIRSEFDDNRRILTEEQKKEREEQKKEREEAKKQAQAAAKQKAEEAQKQAKELEKDQQEFQKQRIENEAEYAKMLFEITQQLYRVERTFIKNEQEKRIAAETQAFEQQRTTRREAYNKFEQDLQASEAQAQKLYGAGSLELQKVVSENEQKRVDTKKRYNNLDAAETKAHNERLLQIEKDAQAERATQQIESLNAELERFRSIYQAQEDAQEEANRKAILQARALGEDKASIEIEQANQRLKAAVLAEQRLTDEINRVERERAGLSGLSAEQRAQIESEQAARLQAREKLNNDIFEAELDLNDRIEAANKESAERRKKTLEDAIVGVLDFAGKGLAVFTDFQKSLADAEIKRLEEQKLGREKAIDDLKKEKETQIGLEAEATQQRIDLETQALDAVDAKKKEIEEEQKKALRFKAVGESIINTAVAVTKALPNPILAAAVGVLGAIQTAAIIAQPLATGGVVEPYSRLSSGIVSKTPNVPKSKSGDSVLAYLGNGEVVLNKPQIQRLGDNALASAGVPGFSGSPQSDNSINPEQLAAVVVQTMTPMLNDFVNQRIEQIPVVITSKGIADANRNQLNIESRRNL